MPVVDVVDRAAAQRMLRSGARSFWILVAVAGGLLALLLAAVLAGGNSSIIACLASGIVILASLVAWLGAGLSQLTRALREADAHHASVAFPQEPLG